MELEEGEHVGDDSVEKEAYMEVDGDNKQDTEKEKSKESGKHRSRDRKEKREDKDRTSGDGERPKTHEVAKDREKELEKREAREKDRSAIREKRTEERDDYKKEHEKTGHKEKMRDKDYDYDKYRDREKDHDYDKYRDRERYRDRESEKEPERDKERGKDRNKDRVRDRDKEKEHNWSRSRDWELDKEAKKDLPEDRTKERTREREKDRDRDRDREKASDGGNERERKKERGKDREGDREKAKDKEREKERDRHKEKSRGKDRQREGAKEREKDLVDEKNLHQGVKKEIVKSKEGGHDEKLRYDSDEETVLSKKGSTHVNAQKSVLDDKVMSREPSVPQPSSLEFEQRVKIMRQERLNKKSEGASEILAWVNKSRRIEEKLNAEKERAQQRSKMFDELDDVGEGESGDEETAHHSAKDLAGVRVLHGLDKVLEGGAVVLTLKDQSILADGDINQEVDMLENVEIGEQKQRDEAYKAAKKKTGIYEDKFSDDPGSERTILPQYDDPVQDEGVKLDESGRFTGEAEKKLEELRRRLQGASTSNRVEDLTSSSKMSSDYYTQEEMLGFKKPKKKNPFRKKSKLDLDALEAEAISAGLGAGDLGSRNEAKRQSAKEEKEKLEAEKRVSAYQSAIAKAEEASKALRMEQTRTILAEADEDAVGEEDEDFYKALETARKLALKKQDEAAALGPQAIANLVVNNQSGASVDSLLGKNEKAPSVEETEENKVVFSEVKNFVWSVGLPEEHKPETEDVFKVEEEDPKSVDGTADDAGGWAEVKDVVMDEVPVKEIYEDIVSDTIIHEPAVGKGLSGVLQLLKERGTLKEGIDWGGRNMDKKKSKLVGINDEDDTKEIRIERLDEFGRVMTPKEAFRMISHKFHGKGPGKMKTEKRMKQYQEELKLKQMKASDTPSLSVERMRETQARLQTPYLVLSGHVKPGQTSDPRSGFATIEKDHPGSLTPMLGDKKVEHFLGIKRKAEPSKLGPPKKAKT